MALCHDAVSITTAAGGMAARGGGVCLTMAGVKGASSEKPEYLVEEILLIKRFFITNGNHLFIPWFVLQGSSL